MKSVKELHLENRKVLVRVDFNVPMDERGVITDDARMREALPTLEYIKKQNGKLIICSHRGQVISAIARSTMSQISNNIIR